MIATIDAGQFEEGALIILELAPVPGDMRGRGIGARRAHGHDRGVIAPILTNAYDRLAHHLGHEIVLAHTGARALDGRIHHLFGDARGTAHEGDFLV